MSDRDFYDILGVSRDADLATLKKAYRKSALENHPDKNPGDPQAEERFKEAAEAYAVLSDPEKRQLYDQFGRAGLGARGGMPDFSGDIFADFGDILGDLFGFSSVFGGRSRGRGRGGRPGRDLRYDLEIDLVEAVQGLETRIQIPRMQSCETCGGSGAQEGGVETCSQCRGHGQVAFQQGFFTIARTCNRCGGTGRRVTKPCKTCDGNGATQVEKTLTVRIPAGVDDGMRLRMAGEGEAGERGAPPGDLYVMIHVREHPIFVRDGREVHCGATLSFSQAALGTRLEVPTLDDETAQVEIPAGTQAGTQFRIRGRGAPEVGSTQRGDQIVTVNLRTPTRLSTEQRELLEQLAEHEDEDREGPGLFERVKNIFS